MKPETLAIHGTTAGNGFGATVTPIYQTVSYAFDTAAELADVFAGKTPGYIYTRIANPTSLALEKRLADLENSIGCIATSSGMAAISSTVLSLTRSGDKILAATGIFGGTVSLFENILPRFSIETVFANAANTETFISNIDDRTKLIFLETIPNPSLEIPDIKAIARAAKKFNIPLIVDNTSATPILVKPGDLGADIVIHSTSKYINGHGTAIGGAIIDTGNYNWRNGVFTDIKNTSKKAGPLAFLSHLRNLVYRDLGGCPAPMNSFIMLQGLETLPIRMKTHCANALKLANYLNDHTKVSWVNYPGLPASDSNQRVADQLNSMAGGLLTFGLGSKELSEKFIDSVKLAKNAANLGDAKTLVLHPASTIFHEFDEQKRIEMSVTDDMIRVSVGIEHFEDIKNDFQQAID
ncbi:MAG: O-acetylhomoserine aminocarboxypropyltransferase/cysteine synthase [Planctomycetes bacterium]|nr:O-acetylhomoserine aminocarboxypropyltransferase/cysteine synthase [Planctomycetota bacterium]